MVCPNCNEAKVKNNICPSCGLDAVLFGRTSIISCSLYNKGLAQANMNDLTGAMANLSKSIEFNKNNILSRNLLGLIYFHIGHIGEALKQWIISKSVLEEGNAATDYIKRLEGNPREIEKMSDAAACYNHALDYIAQRNLEMASIQLKKALEVNPAFVDALNLLTLCCLLGKDRGRAEVLIEKVLAVDINNSLALHYYTQLNPGKKRPEPTQAVKLQTTYAGTPRQRSTRQRESHYVTEVLCFLIGLVSASALMFFLVVPGHVAASNREITTLRQTLEETENRLATESDASSETISDLRTRVGVLEQENSVLSVQADQRNRFEAILRASDYMSSRNVMQAANIIRAIGDLESLPSELRTTAEDIRNEAFPLAASLAFEEAVARYNTGDYGDAREWLDASIEFGADGLAFYDRVLFHMGSLAEVNQEFETAMIYYQHLVQSFPGSPLRNEASLRLNTLSHSLN